MSFNKSDYYIIESPGDGDCFFHSIVGFNHLHDLKKKAPTIKFIKNK